MRPETVRELVDNSAREYAESIAYVDNGVKFSFADLKRDVDAMARYLVKAGLSGKHIALLGPNSYRWVVAYLAVLSGVGVCVPLPMGLPAANIQGLCRLADAEAILTDAEGEFGVQKLPLNGVCAEETALPAPKPEDLCQIIFTSGTTGTPKGVELTQANVMCIANCEFIPLAGRIGISILPASHAFEGVCHILVMLNTGATLYMCPSLMKFAPLVAQSGCDVLYLVPALAGALLTKFTKFLEQATSLKRIVCGGAPVPMALVEAYKQRGIEVFTGYGLSECSPLVSLNYELVEGSCGRIGSYCEARAAEDGEIQVRGLNVMRGYYKNEAATKAAFTEDGWLKTGDLGYVDANNHLFLTGRIKNLIILSNGENVSPEELENLIIDSVPGTVDALVYADGDVLAATVYTAAEDIKEGIDKLNRSLPTYKRIMKYSLTREPLPTSANGKKLRK